MKDNAIDVEVVPVEIVRCPRCGVRNRLLKQERHVGYRCGGCWGALGNPFERLSVVKRCFQAIARRNSGNGMGKIIAAFVAALIVVGLAMHQHAPPVEEVHSPPSAPPAPMPNRPQTWLPPESPPTDPVVFPPQQSRAIPPIDIMPTPRPPRETPAPPPRSLDNGTILLDVINAGHSEFTVDNGTERDAVIKLIDPRKRQTVVSFYVRAQESVTADLIPEGTFTVLCGQGVDWDDKTGFLPGSGRFKNLSRTWILR